MRISIIGAARSGIAAANLAKDSNYDIFISEFKTADNFDNLIPYLEERNIQFEFGQHSSNKILKSDFIVVSPGVPNDLPVLLEAECHNIPIISEIEFAWRNCDNKIIAITGTNGKTTTTKLTEFILNKSGKKAIAAGNIGNPFSEVIRKIDKETIVVLEVSSYQLDRIVSFNPDVSVILNITPDHLSYHKSMENYIKAKLNIYKNHNENNLLILNSDDEILIQNEHFTRGRVKYFSFNKKVEGIYCQNGEIILNYSDKHKEGILMSIEELSLPGLHNVYNSMAAALSARAFEITNENLRDSLMQFDGVEHRLEFVRTINGVDFINDSKATNVNATWYALSSYDNPIIWIAGGRADNNDYSQLDQVVKDNVKSIICFGEEADNIFNHFAVMKRCFKVIDLEEAIIKALEISQSGDIVLFTPACKSFDMFLNFEHRGEVFKDIVNGL